LIFDEIQPHAICGAEKGNLDSHRGGRCAEEVNERNTDRWNTDRHRVGQIAAGPKSTKRPNPGQDKISGEGALRLSALGTVRDKQKRGREQLEEEEEG